MSNWDGLGIWFMTYGWAILASIVAISALYFFLSTPKEIYDDNARINLCLSNSMIPIAEVTDMTNYHIVQCIAYNGTMGDAYKIIHNKNNYTLEKR